MKTFKEFIAFVESISSHVLFCYNGKECGVDPISSTQYTLWYGDFEITCHCIDEVKNGKYFDGKSLSEIFDNITDIEY